MKKSLKVSLGGIVFNIDEDAYAALEAYLNSLKRKLGNTSEAHEIIRDIEERAADLFTEMLQGSEIVTIVMVSKVAEILGNPEQISDEEDPSTHTNSSTASSYFSRKRLYRDGDNAIVAGISAGLGAYFNISPIVFRLIFVALIFAKGFGLLAYLILWIAVPRAVTARQRMEMRGEDINFSNLEKNIKSEFNEVKNNMKKHRVSDFFERVFHGIGRVFIVLGRAMGGVAKVLVAIIAVVFISIGLVGLLSVVASFFLGEVITMLLPQYAGLTPTQFLATTIDLGSMLWITIPLFLIVAIPLATIVYLGLRMVVNFKARNSLLFVISATAWIVSVAVLAFVLFFQARSFTIRESVKERTVLTELASESELLKVYAFEQDEIDGVALDKIAEIDDYAIVYDNNNTRVIGKPKLIFEKSSDDSFEVVVEKKSRGATISYARNSAKRINMDFAIEGNTISFSKYFYLPLGDKWRTQDVDIIIYIPEGKRIYIDDSVEEIIRLEQDFCLCWPDEMIGKTWIMEKNRLKEF